MAATKKKISFFLFPAPLGQICFVLVLISPNHKARNRYPEMDMARTVYLRFYLTVTWPEIPWDMRCACTDHLMRLIRELLHHGRRAGIEKTTQIWAVSGETAFILHIETYNLLFQRQSCCKAEMFIEKVIDRPTQTPLCGFTFAMQKPLIKASL